MVRNFTARDEGKTVVDADGDAIGTIERVSSDRAYVMPEQSLSESIRSRLGWDDDAEDTYVLEHSRVARFEDDEVHLRG